VGAKVGLAGDQAIYRSIRQPGHIKTGTKERELMGVLPFVAESDKRVEIQQFADLRKSGSRPEVSPKGRRPVPEMDLEVIRDRGAPQGPP
jgi:hypothetical protein